MKSISTFFSKITMGKGLLLLLSPLLTALISMKAALLGLLILIFIDLLTGIRKSHYEKNINFNPFNGVFWGSIKSYLLRQTWRKFYEYGIGILVVVVFETLVFGTPMNIIFAKKAFTLAEVLTVIPALIEVWSIFENLEAVSGKNVFKRIQYLLPISFRELFKKKSDV